MAEAVLLFGIAKSVLQQLASPALNEIRLLWGHKAQFEKLEKTVTTIRDVLQDADRKQATDARVQGWLARLRVVLYDADDFFDDISARVLLDKAKKGTEIGKKVRHFVSQPYRFAFMVKKAHKVKKLRERFDDIAADIAKFNFLPITTELDPTSRVQLREETHSFVPTDEVIGLEEEKEGLVGVLLPHYSQQQISSVSVIAIVGIGGSGKTTLAKFVFNDTRVQRGFDLCMWISINYFSDLKQVLKKLLKSIPLLISAPISEIDYYDLDRLQASFRQEIKGKRFLLVLDDLWDQDPENWDELKQLLSSGRDGSKILTTTRTNIVARGLWATKSYFPLKGMSEDNGWLLCKKIAFADEGDRNISEFEQIGREIVRKCANIPLVIVTIAKLLRGKDKEMWLTFLNDDLSKVIPGDYKKIMKTLGLSYKELPYSVKLCFGYCSLFPKGFEFEKGYLARLWIAQGFVEPLPNQSLEDTAEEYFFCLVERCAFQLTTGDEKRKSIVTYQMHHLMHDLAKEVARDECISVDNTTLVSSDKTFCHVSINGDLKSMVDRVCSFSHSKRVRTFLRPRGGFTATDALEELMSSFKSLRVLDLSETWSDIPASIGGLIHLRLLDLSKNYALKRLPRSICSLAHLQSLILRECDNLEELPKNLGDLLNLRHLVLKGCDSLVKLPPGLSALTSLVTLDKLVVHNSSGGLEYLKGLDNLTGSLQIELPSTEWESVAMDATESFLSRKTRLHSLAIICRTELDTIGIHSCYELDSLLELPPNLVILKLEGFKRCGKLPSLSHLQSLKELWISGMDSMLNIEESKSYEPNSFFPSLETLWIKDMWNLRSWWTQPPTVLPTFPCLTGVSICNCPKLTRCIPLFPRVEDLCLINIREEVIWQIIGIEANCSTSQGNSVLKKLEIRESEDLQHSSKNDCYQLKSIPLNGLAYLTSLEYLKIEINKWGKIIICDGQEAGARKIH